MMPKDLLGRKVELFDTVFWIKCRGEVIDYCHDDNGPDFLLIEDRDGINSFDIYPDWEHAVEIQLI